MTLEQIVAGVRKHALENYERGGWDYLVECFSDDEIANLITQEGITTLEQAISLLQESLGAVADMRSQAIGYGGGCPECLSFRKHEPLCSKKGSIQLEED